MPKLSSGRHVALSASPYLDALDGESDEAKYFAIVALRLHAGNPEALRDHLVIGYFVDDEGAPPNAPVRDSGYCVADVLAGRTDWSDDEIEEFRRFIDSDPRFGPWLQSQFDEINEAIRSNPVWRSDLLVNDHESDGIDAPQMKRTIIQASAEDPGAMAQLRAPGSRLAK